MNIHAIYGLILPYFRRKRFKKFWAIFQPQAGSTLLDVGGYPYFWSGVDHRLRITVLNLAFPTGLQAGSPDYALVAGDGTRLSFQNGSFDIAFSNSVIEHLSTWENQQRFAAEIRRTGRRVWVQTPARWFFMEPHLLTPFIHFFPRSWQRRMLRRCTVWGWIVKPSQVQVDAFLNEVRLLKFSEMQSLFADCRIIRERFLGMTKSYIAVR